MWGRGLIPAIEVFGDVGHLVLGEHGVHDTLSLLGAVVFQQAEGILAQQHDGNEVADGHEAHGDIGKAPREVEAHDGATHDHAAHEHTVEPQEEGAAADEADVGLTVVVVADDAAEGKEQDGNGHEHGAEAAHLLSKSGLGELYAIE